MLLSLNFCKHVLVPFCPHCVHCFYEVALFLQHHFLQEIKGLFIWFNQISRQVRQNMSRFHLEHLISLSKMKSTGSELAANQNTAFNLGNRARLACSYGEFSSRLTMISLLTGEIRASEPACFLI